MAVAGKLRECQLCDFSTTAKDKFSSHIRTHKTRANASSPQCGECGMIFASDKARATHLLLLHAIKMDADGRVTNGAGGRSKKRPRPVPTPPTDTDPDDPYAFEDESKKEVCSVCRARFGTALELKKHFRSHGMAFLQTAAKKEENASVQKKQ